MKRRTFLAASASAAILAGCGIAPGTRRRRPPNVVLIMADDLGYGDLSATGRAEYRTPSIDRIAGEGVRLAQAYSAAPVCTPTRVALATGRYPARDPIGLYEPLTGQRDLGLAPSPATLGTLMKRAGYDTGLVGKWHLGLAPASHPLEHGYDHFYGFLGAAIDYSSLRDTETREHLFYDDREPVAPGRYATDLISDRAHAFVSRERSAPFFLNLQFNAPHWPWQGPNDTAYPAPDSVGGSPGHWSQGGSPEIFAAMMTSMDAGVGGVLDALRARDIERDTLVIFTSDNGGERFSHMGPFSAGKMTLNEGGIRVAAFARWPGVIAAGSECEQVAITMDWTATLAALGGVEADANAPFDGIDLLPAMKGEAEPRARDLFWRIHQRRRQKAARSGDWKYLENDQGEFLFDLANDPGERTDLKSARPEELARVKSLYASWAGDVLPPIELDPDFA